MAALTTIATTLLVTSLVLSAVSLTTSVIAAKTGNKTLAKIGKISGYVAMGTGVASAGFGIAASMAANTATQAAAHTARATAVHAASTGSKTVAAAAATGLPATSAAPAVTGTVAQGAQGAVATSGGKFGSMNNFVQSAVQSAGPTPTPATTVSNPSHLTMGEKSLQLSKPVMDQAQQVAPTGRTHAQVPEPPLEELAVPDGIVRGPAPPQNLAVSSPWMPKYMTDLMDDVKAGASKVGDWTEKNQLLSFGIMNTVGSGLGSLFEADVAEEKLKQDQRQFDLTFNRQSAPQARNL